MGTLCLSRPCSFARLSTGPSAMKISKVAVLALVALLGWSALNSDSSQVVDGVRSGSRKLLQAAGNPMSTLITIHYPPPPPSKEYVAAIARQQKLRDLLYGSLTPPGMQAMVAPDADVAAIGEDAAPSDPTQEVAAAPEGAEEEEEAEEDVGETVKDGGPFLVLGVSVVVIGGIGAAVFAVYRMRDSPWLNEVMKGGVKKTVMASSTADSHSASRSEVLKAKMAKLRESINNSA